MRTFSLDTLCTLEAVSFELSIGGYEPFFLVGLNNLFMREDWTVGHILQEVLISQCYMLIFSEAEAEELRKSEWSGTWWTCPSNTWADSKTPTLDHRPDVLHCEFSRMDQTTKGGPWYLVPQDAERATPAHEYFESFPLLRDHMPSSSGADLLTGRRCGPFTSEVGLKWMRRIMSEFDGRLLSSALFSPVVERVMYGAACSTVLRLVEKAMPRLS